MSVRLSLRRAARIPDELRVARCRRAPETGPRILFFSGGSALRELLGRGERPAEWMIRPEIAQIVLDALAAGEPVFVREASA